MEDQSQMDQYEIVKLLGKGAYGRALLCRDTPNERLVVIKQVSSMGRDKLEEARQEGEILAQLDHPNVVGFYDSFVDTDPVEGNCLNIVMEYCDGGDLDAAIKRRRNLGKPFAELHVMRIFVQLTLALKYIHHHKILHRDIKPQNVFLTSDGCVKLGDFGVAKSLSSTASMAHTQLGTPYYLSPEIFNDENYDSSSDMWSLGVLAFELTTLALPFQAASLGKLAVRVLRDEPPIPTCSPELQQVLGKLLTKRAQDRPAATELLRLPFVRDHARRLLDHTAATGLGGLEEDVNPSRHASPLHECNHVPENLPPPPDDVDEGDDSQADACDGFDHVDLVVDRDATGISQPDTSTHCDDARGDPQQRHQQSGDDDPDTKHNKAEGKSQNPHVRPRSGSRNPYARQRPLSSEPTMEHKDEAIRPAQHSSPQTSDFNLETNMTADDDADSGGIMMVTTVVTSDGESETASQNDEEPDSGEEHQAAALTIQRSWRNLAAVPDAPRLPPRRHPHHSGDASPNIPRPMTQGRRRQNQRRSSTKKSIKETLARAAERGAARRAQSEVKQREQRIKMCNERGEPVEDFESPHEETAIAENTVVIHLSEKRSGRPASGSKIPQSVADVEPETAYQTDDGMSNSTTRELVNVSASWRVRGHITAAEERGKARKALAEEKAAKVQRELEHQHGLSRQPEMLPNGNMATAQSPSNNSIAPAKRRRRRWEEANRWVPELPTLAASNSNLDQHLAQECSSPTPAAAGAAGRAVSAARSARRGLGDTSSPGRRDITKRYPTRPTSKALQDRLRGMLDDEEGV